MVGLFLSATVATAAFAMAERSGQGARPASRPGTPRPSPPAHALPADAAPTTTTVPTVPTTTVPTLPPAPPNPPAPGALSTDPAAWAGHGDLAFVSRGQLFVLDNAGQLSTITGPAAGGFDSGPSWSVGGQWLAFLHTDASSGFSIPAPTLWLAAADSTIAHEVTPQGVTMFAWSPVTAELAFSVAISTNGTAPVPENLYVDEPGSSPVRLPIGSGNGVEDLAWSPDGRQIAFDDAEYAQPATATSPATPSAGQLGVISATGGSAHIAFRLLGTNVRVAAWWPQGGGLLFWEAPGFEEAADGLTLYSLASGTSTPVPLLASLVAPLWVAPEPGGGTVAVVVGTGRSIWSTGRDVELCTLPSAAMSPSQRVRRNRVAGAQLDGVWCAALLGGVDSGALRQRRQRVLDPRVHGALGRDQHRVGAHVRRRAKQACQRTTRHPDGFAGYRRDLGPLRGRRRSLAGQYGIVGAGRHGGGSPLFRRGTERLLRPSRLAGDLLVVTGGNGTADLGGAPRRGARARGNAVSPFAAPGRSVDRVA